MRVLAWPEWMKVRKREQLVSDTVLCSEEGLPADPPPDVALDMGTGCDAHIHTTAVKFRWDLVLV